MAERMAQAELNAVIAEHGKWLRGESGARAALVGYDLLGLSMLRADLRGASLCGAVLRGADLRDTNLCGADLRGADLCGADLRGAVLRGADLRGADLRDADLCHAVLRDAVLRGADLRDADLRGADLRDADLPTGYAIATLCFGGWPVTVTPTATTIGCCTYPNEQWLGWGVDAPEIAEMHYHAAAWWRRHRDAVCAVIRDVMGGDAHG